jgi:hypothetical protein
VELIPELEEVRRGTESLQTLESEPSVGLLVEDEAAEKEYCICLKAEEVGKLLALVPCGHRCVCADCYRVGREGSVGRRILSYDAIQAQFELRTASVQKHIHSHDEKVPV